MTLEIYNEDQILDEFRERVKDLCCSDATLRRFLRARNHNLENAEAMLRKAMEWRKVNHVDSALTFNTPEIIVKSFPLEFSGVDNQNQCVMYMPWGSWPTRQMVEAGYKEEMKKHIYTVLETIMQETDKTGEQFTLIMDMAEGNVWNFTHYESMQLVHTVLQSFETAYPERLSEALVINAPFYLMFLWNFIKPILTGNTLSKVSFLSNSPDKFMSTLLDKMPASAIPSRLKKYL